MLKYFLSSTTSHPPGVLRPTDCLGSGRTERGLNCPSPPLPPSRLRQLMRLPRPWQVKAEKPSSRVRSQGQALLWWKLRFSIWIWIEKWVRCGLSFTGDWSLEGGEGRSRGLCQGEAKLEVTAWAKAKPASNGFRKENPKVTLTHQNQHHLISENFHIVNMLSQVFMFSKYFCMFLKFSHVFNFFNFSCANKAKTQNPVFCWELPERLMAIPSSYLSLWPAN